MNHDDTEPTPDDKSFDALFEATETSDSEGRSIANFLKILEAKAGKISAELGLKDSKDFREIALITRIEMRATLLELQLNDGVISLAEAMSKKRQLLADYTVIEELDRNDPLFELIDKLVPGGHIDVEDDDMQPHYAESMAELASRTERRMQSSAIMDKAFLAAGLNPQDMDEETSTARLTIAQMLIMSQLTDDRINARANRHELMFDIARKHKLDSRTAQKIIRYIDTEFPN